MAETRLGRPKSSNAHETRRRILEAARGLFADRGFEGASNRAIAEAANLTTGAIYHYFDRKLDIYLAVYVDTQAQVHDRLGCAVAPCETLIDALRVFLETAHDLNNEDPSLAMFLHSCRVDTQRDSSLARSLSEVDKSERNDFFNGLTDLGVRTGELDDADTASFLVLLRTITVGLVDEVSGDRKRHRQAVDALLALLEGKLLRPPASA